MAELTYSIQNIFNDSTSEGCLLQYEASTFFIPTYQRGYKWGSKTENDPVPILLNDLYSAFRKAPAKKYYLQYITISKKGKLMEVIDGQQRLTTLSIMLSVFNLLLENIQNISDKKLKYAIRPSIFEDHIYPKDKLKLFIDEPWNENGIILNDQNVNNQDIFYLHEASVKIHNFLNDIKSNESGEKHLGEFYTFFTKEVMIILNAVESHIPGEKVFRNLNSKKVPLTEVELIKGLLLTKVSRNQNENDKRKHFREILEIRSTLGRRWDEMSSKSNEPGFSFFFFKEGQGFEGLIELAAVLNGYKPSKKESEKHYPLFNFFNNSPTKVQHFFDEIILYFSILFDWYENPEIYNLLGYTFFGRGQKSDFKGNFIKENLRKAKSELIKILLELRNINLSDKPASLKYGESDHQIHNVLLALSVFPKLENADIKEIEVLEMKFDFYTYSNLNWTLEHIFPQSPEGKKRVLTDEQKEKIYEMLGGKDNLDPAIKAILELPERTDEQKQIYYDALKSIGPLNEIGNMALLSDSLNASIGCGFFDEKRKDILRHMQKGKFVPLHTFNVFSKTILGANPGDLLAWSKQDVSNHTTAIEDRIKELKEQQSA
jgi:hypothetical protein